MSRGCRRADSELPARTVYRLTPAPAAGASVYWSNTTFGHHSRLDDSFMKERDRLAKAIKRAAEGSPEREAFERELTALRCGPVAVEWLRLPAASAGASVGAATATANAVPAADTNANAIAAAAATSASPSTRASRAITEAGACTRAARCMHAARLMPAAAQPPDATHQALRGARHNFRRTRILARLRGLRRNSSLTARCPSPNPV